MKKALLFLLVLTITTCLYADNTELNIKENLYSSINYQSSFTDEIKLIEEMYKSPVDETKIERTFTLYVSTYLRDINIKHEFYFSNFYKNDSSKLLELLVELEKNKYNMNYYEQLELYISQTQSFYMYEREMTAENNIFIQRQKYLYPFIKKED